jgi:hypothetical protein
VGWPEGIEVQAVCVHLGSSTDSWVHGGAFSQHAVNIVCLLRSRAKSIKNDMGKTDK